MLSFSDPIVAVTLSLAGHTGITLYAPPWRDADGEEWQGFLGDGAKIVLLGTASELADWIKTNPEHDLADHPAWPAFAKRGAKVLQPAEAAHYDFEAAYEFAAAGADDDTIASLAAIIDMASRVADCCEDGALRSLLNGTGDYRYIIEDDADYEGKDGQVKWSRLGDTIADSWPRAITRLQSWLSWHGSAAAVSTEDLDEDEPNSED
jgi:hypothetical protein